MKSLRTSIDQSFGRFIFFHVPKQKVVDPKSGKKVGPTVSERICQGEGRFGLIETAVNNALAKKKAKFLKDATIYRSQNCIIVEGTAYQ